MCDAVEKYAEKYAEKYGEIKRQEGIKEGILKTVKIIIQDGKYSDEEISESMNIPLEDVQRIAAQTS